MFRKPPKLPVSLEQQTWIESSFAHLTELFGKEWVMKAPLVLPTEQHFPRKWEASQAWAEFAFDRACQLMHVDRERIELVFEFDAVATLVKSGIRLERTRGAAGLYQKIKAEDGPSKALITIKRSLFDEPEKMVATMAHELAHVLLLGDGRIERDIEKMEELTDLMTVFSGFGILNANSAHVHRSGAGGWSVSWMGYLTPAEYAYSLALFAWVRGEKNPSWDRELSTNVRAFMRSTFAYFKASGRADMG
jgi:hypothetical protein